MKKILTVFFLLAAFLYADIVNDSNLNVLQSLNVEDSFLLNKQLQRKYKEFAKRKRKYYLNIIENGFAILPIIRQKIIKSHIPKELIAVAMAESYFSLNARSDKRAVGLWQFMPETARRFGLKIDAYVDERKDPIKSTQAAIDYLKYLHNFFGKWYLAIMAYNAGAARTVEGVVRAKVDKLCMEMGRKCYTSKKIRRYREIIRYYQIHGRWGFDKLYWLYKKLKYVHVDLADLLRVQPHLKRQYFPKETRNYIIKVIAMSFLFNSENFVKYTDSYLLNSGVTPEYTKVYVPAGTSLYYVAKMLHMDYYTLREHNMQLRYAFTPPYKYYIYIPYQKLAYFKEHFHPKKFFFVYRVKKGDTLYKIAQTFDTKVWILKDYNKIGRYLRVGEKIVIPLNERFIAYRVRPGDTLAKIARKFGVSYKKIMKLNGIKTALIRVGQVIKIPQKL
jgi:membrane-bound lytic murein transglycosylase D